MDQLSGTDGAFLHIETPETPMHVGSLQIFDLPEGYKGEFFEDAKRFVGGRMHMASVFQRKLALMPFDLANPVWVDDEDVDLDYHMRRITLPKPGTWAQLEQYVARLHSSLLDRSRPLWEVYIFDGLKTGQVASYTKVHHAAIDGQAGVAMTKALYTDTANPPPVKPPRVRPRTNRYQLGVAELAGAALSNAVAQYFRLVKAAPGNARSLISVLLPVSEKTGKRRFTLPKRFEAAPRTPLNVSITNQRAFAARSLSLAEIKGMARHSGNSLNDIVLAICAGALKRYLADYDCKPDKPLAAAVPISLRSPGDTAMNNQSSMMLVSLATDIDDPLLRLAAIHDAADVGKKMTGRFKGAMTTEIPSLGAPWLMSGLASLASRSRLGERLPALANVIVSNVPGPQTELYFAGARLVGFYPVSIPQHGMALNITCQSYNGLLEFGLTACRRAMPDVADLADYIVDEHRKLLARIMAEPSRAAMADPRLDAAVKAPVAKAPARKRPRVVPAKALPPPKPASAGARKSPVSSAAASKR